MRRGWTEEAADLAPLPEMSWDEFQASLVPVAWDDVDAAAGRLGRIARQYSRRYRDSRERFNMWYVALCIGFQARKDRGIIDANGNVRIVTLTTIKQISEWTGISEVSVQKYLHVMLEDEKFPLTRIVRGNHDVAGKPRPSVFAVSDMSLSVAESSHIVADDTASDIADSEVRVRRAEAAGRQTSQGPMLKTRDRGSELHSISRTPSSTARNDYIDGSLSLKTSLSLSQDHKSERDRGEEQPWEAAGVSEECWTAAMAVDASMTCRTKRGRRAELAQAVSSFVEEHSGISLDDVVSLARAYSGNLRFGQTWLEREAGSMAEDLLQGRRDERRERRRRDMSELTLPELAHVIAQGARIGHYGSFGGGWFASPDNPLWDRGAIDFASDAEVRGLTDEEVRSLLEKRILEELSPRTAERVPQRAPEAVTHPPKTEATEEAVPDQTTNGQGPTDTVSTPVATQPKAAPGTFPHLEKRGRERRRHGGRRAMHGRGRRGRPGHSASHAARRALPQAARHSKRGPIKPYNDPAAAPSTSSRAVGTKGGQDGTRTPRPSVGRTRAPCPDTSGHEKAHALGGFRRGRHSYPHLPRPHACGGPFPARRSRLDQPAAGPDG